MVISIKCSADDRSLRPRRGRALVDRDFIGILATMLLLRLLPIKKKTNFLEISRLDLRPGQVGLHLFPQLGGPGPAAPKRCPLRRVAGAR